MYISSLIWGREIDRVFSYYLFSCSYLLLHFSKKIMSDYEQFRVFVGGLSWEINDRELEDEFRRFGKVLDAKVIFFRNICIVFCCSYFSPSHSRIFWSNDPNVYYPLLKQLLSKRFPVQKTNSNMKYGINTDEQIFYKLKNCAFSCEEIDI